MSGQWIPVTEAIGRYIRKKRVKPEQAIAAVARLCEKQHVASKIGAISSDDGFGPTSNVIMSAMHWDYIWSLNRNDWFVIGKAFLPDDTVWHDLQVSLSDLEREIGLSSPAKADWIKDFRDTPHPPNSLRAPSVKEGASPSDDKILEKADEMKSRGLTGYEIASQMRHEDGFRNVATTVVRDRIKGRYTPSGRPSRKDA